MLIIRSYQYITKYQKISFFVIFYPVMEKVPTLKRDPKTFSWETDLWVTPHDFAVKKKKKKHTRNLKRKSVFNQKSIK